ncbi:hypothetical protein ABZ746_15830 [Streptomyces sp. NPDC020096]
MHDRDDRAGRGRIDPGCQRRADLAADRCGSVAAQARGAALGTLAVSPVRRARSPIE